ncbi:MAG: polynucleotide adenylyltransferase [Clostridia bacterium]|nr:polynucleotide adenylyltransferase [Clostridia bacterium]
MRDIHIENNIPAHIWDVCHRFYSAGEDAYIVGGSLRDIMLGRAPSDFDLATSALPQRTAELFSDMRVIETGIKHGTVTVIVGGAPVEITTFRIDGSYTDSRHPDGVSFTGRIEEDLARRDFTVNAMAYNDRSGLVDPFGGRDDLRDGIIRAVGDSRRRFSEDALRIMRAFRFSAQLGFEIDYGTLSGAKEQREGLANIARERIAVEFLKLITSKEPEAALTLMTKAEALTYITGEYRPSERIFSLISKMPCDEGARLGFFLSEASEDAARSVLRGLKYSNALTTAALAVIRGSRRAVESPADARKLIGECGAYARSAACASVLLGLSCADAPLWVEKNTAPTSLRDLCVTGKDLMEIGVTGKEVGRVLGALLAAVIEEPRLNEREMLIKMAEDILNKA